MVINDYYSTLSIKEKSMFIAQVQQLCDFSYPTFMLKMRKNNWSKLEREAVLKLIEDWKNERQETTS